LIEKLKQRGIGSIVYLVFALLSGVTSVILGASFAYPDIYIDRLILVVIGVFVTQAVITHGIHDYYMYGEVRRVSPSKKRLKRLIILGFIISGSIAVYLSITVSLYVLIFAAVGFVMCFYAKNLLYEDIMFPIAISTATIASFYVQTVTITPSIIALASFIFLCSLGEIRIYRFDDTKEDLRLYINKNLLWIGLSWIPLILAILLK